ncbi:MAG: PAQR family membrane homeostasis protein TrhA, partial [Mycobacteriaceae bacterium]
MAALASGIEGLPVKPRMRGWIHLWACVISIISGVVLVWVSW